MPEIMDGKNIADFIDPDIAEKLEALEREEEKLQAEGFYDSDSDIFDSDDEREAQEAEVALSHKIKSQSIKKLHKNQARLPRTAGLRTLSELTEEMTKAGLDPSRIQERAEMLAKVQGVKRKRHRDEDGDIEMRDDIDADAGEDNWMDVDEDDEVQSPPKRKKGNTGRVVAAHPRAPTKNRQLAGLRDASVSPSFLGYVVTDMFLAIPDGSEAT